MLHGGLVSISFRNHSPAEVVDLVAKGGLGGIEWGGDVHVPHGEMETAREVRSRTEDAGLTVAAYGSYFHCGRRGDEKNPDFRRVLETALELGAPLIRIWSGKRASADATDAERRIVLEDAAAAGELAAQNGMQLAFEFHRGSLTDTADATRWLLSALDNPMIKTYWQPPLRTEHAARLAGLKSLLTELAHLHVFHWEMPEGKIDRRPLAEGRQEWLDYLRAAASTGREHFAMLEFVREDTPEQFLEDAATLKSWIEEVNRQASESVRVKLPPSA